MLTALQASRARTVAAFDAGQQDAFARREAERVELEPEAWIALRQRRPDLVVLREIHTAISEKASVRRADRDGEWTIAKARPGHLRSQPQLFRVNDRTEPAWDHNTLAQRVAELIATTSDAAAADPVRAAATLVWTMARAQPFLGENERAAIVLASVLLARCDLPVLTLHEIATDREFHDALAADTTEPLVAYVGRHVWDAALDFAEWVGASAADGARWSLAAEHATHEAARARAPEFDREPLGQLIDDVVALLTAQLGPAGAIVRMPTEAHADRLRVAIASARRGRLVSVHRPLHEVRIRIDERVPLDAVIVAGAAGRGVTGGVGLHLALELANVPPTTGRASPGLLLVPGERLADQRARLREWSARVIARALRESPVYG